MNLERGNLNRKIEKTLYHYTTQEGFLGIIKNKEIWASHTQYLNDQKEYVHAIDLVKHVLENARSRFFSPSR